MNYHPISEHFTLLRKLDTYKYFNEMHRRQSLQLDLEREKMKSVRTANKVKQHKVFNIDFLPIQCLSNMNLVESQN